MKVGRHAFFLSFVFIFSTGFHPEMRCATTTMSRELKNPTTTLRARPDTLTFDELYELSIYVRRVNADGARFDFIEFEIQGDRVIYDEATGLLWQQSGSFTTATFLGCTDYIAKINDYQYAGITDWRLPTIEEAYSLLTSHKRYVHTEAEIKQLREQAEKELREKQQKLNAERSSDSLSLGKNDDILHWKLTWDLRSMRLISAYNDKLKHIYYDLYIDSVFSNQQDKIWTADLYRSNYSSEIDDALFVDFHEREGRFSNVGFDYYVRAVKTIANVNELRNMVNAEQQRLIAVDEMRKSRAHDDYNADNKTARVRLRTTPARLSEEDVRSMLQKHHFYCGEWSEGYQNPSGRGMDNDIRALKDGQVVCDFSTGLMWMKGGSSEWMVYDEALFYTKKLNICRFAGYDDWRLPTLEEAMSLMDAQRSYTGFFMDPAFSKRQESIWTCDMISDQRWIVSYHLGYCSYYTLLYFPRSYAFTRAVRTMDGRVTHSDVDECNFVRFAGDTPTVDSRVDFIWHGHLRNLPVTLPDSAVRDMIKENGFYDSMIHPTAVGFPNNFEMRIIAGDRVIVDHATDLMWQQNGSPGYMVYDSSAVYIDQLNTVGYAGYHDWRLPTLEEGMSLIECDREDNNLCIDFDFNSLQQRIWTSDTGNLESYAWGVYFESGHCELRPFGSRYFSVRAVRGL
ncbi:MAG: DUF1566 domain-containing protein [bacterium]